MHIHGTAGQIVGQSWHISSYVHGIPGPKDAGHTNDWCISTGQMHEPPELPEISSLKRPIETEWFWDVNSRMGPLF